MFYQGLVTIKIANTVPLPNQVYNLPTEIKSKAGQCSNAPGLQTFFIERARYNALTGQISFTPANIEDSFHFGIS